MTNGIHHLNFIVRDLEQAVPVWEKLLGMPVDCRDELTGRGVIAARFRLGETWLVLVQPTRVHIPTRMEPAVPMSVSN